MEAGKRGVTDIFNQMRVSLRSVCPRGRIPPMPRPERSAVHQHVLANAIQYVFEDEERPPSPPSGVCGWTAFAPRPG
jgi:hypothetical protein